MLGHQPTILLFVICWQSCMLALADDPIAIAAPTRTNRVDFAKEVYPFLKSNCISCHNKTTARGELNMETVDSMLQGGASGAAIVVGKGSESLLLRCAAGLEEPSMPPKENKVKAKNLTPQQLGLLQLWIDQGAVAPQKMDAALNWESMPTAIHGIYAAAITQDGHWAACSRGGRVFMYHLPTQRLASCLADPMLESLAASQDQPAAHRDLIPALAFSPDGTVLASGSYREVKLWKRHDNQRWEALPDGEASKPLQESAALAVTVLANGQHLEGQTDGQLILWDAAHTNKLRQWNHGSPLLAVAASPDGSRVVSSGNDKSVKVWNAETGELVAQLSGEQAANAKATSALRWVEFCASEVQVHQQILQKHQDDLKRWAERAGKLKTELDAAEKTFAPKQKAYDEALAANKEVRQTLRALYVQLQPSEAGTEVPDDAVRKSRDESEAKLLALSKTLRDLEKEVVQAKDSLAQMRSELTLASSFLEKQPATIKQAQLTLEEAKQVLQAAEAEAQTTAKQAADGQAIARFLTCSVASDRFAYWTEDERVHIASLRDGRLIQSYSLKSEALGGVKHLTWDNAGLVVTSQSGRRLRLHDSVEWKLETQLDDTKLLIRERVTAMQFSPDGRMLAVGSGECSRSGDVAVWDLVAGRCLKNLPDLQRDAVLSLAFTRDGRRVATGSADKSIKVLATDEWSLLSSFEGHTSHVLGVAWHAGGRTLASAGADNVVKIWDVVSGDRKQNIESWDAEITSVQFVGLTGKLLAASGDRRVRLLDESGNEVRSFPDCREFMQCAAASESGSVVIGGSQAGELTVWDGNNGQVLVRFPSPAARQIPLPTSP